MAQSGLDRPFQRFFAAGVAYGGGNGRPLFHDADQLFKSGFAVQLHGGVR